MHVHVHPHTPQIRAGAQWFVLHLAASSLLFKASGLLRLTYLGSSWEVIVLF